MTLPPKTTLAKKVLVVNDDHIQLQFISHNIRELGLVTVLAANGEEALQRVHDSGPFDLVVTDLFMPGIDGWKLCRLLRSEEFADLNPLPILVLSATFAGREAERVTEELGANGFMAIPYKKKEFMETIRRLLAGQPAKQRVKVLVVEDDQTLLQLLTAQFRERGYEVFQAVDGAAAVTLFKEESPDLLILDYRLPDVTADILLPTFKDPNYFCAVIVVTADPSPGLALTLTQLGASAYVRKPFDIEYLISLCEKVRSERALLRVEQLLEARTRELLINEKKYRDLIENAVDLIFLLDSDGRIMEVNDAFLKQGGYQEAELLGRSYTSLLHPEDQTAIRGIQEETRQGRATEFEARLKLKDGRYFWLSITIRPIIDPDGVQVALHGIGRIIEKRKRAEEELRQSEERYRSLIEQTREPIAVFQNEKLLYVNSAFCRLMGAATPDDLIGRSLETVIHPADLAMVQSYARQRLQGIHAPEKYEVRGQRLDGQMLWIEISVTLRKYNDQPAIQVAYHDITKRKIAEEALRESEQKYRTLVESSEMGIFILRNERFVFANESLCQIIQNAMSEIMDSRLIEHLTPDSEKKIAPLLQRWNYESEIESLHEIEIQRPDGRPRLCLLRLRNVKYQGWPAIHGILTDISAQKELEAQLRQAQKMEAIGTLAGGIAHDFNNLLTGIIGNISLAKLQADEENLRYLQEASRAAERAADLVRQLLTFSRKSQTMLKPIDPVPIIRETGKLLRETIDRRIKVHWAIPLHIWQIFADPGQIHQVVMNLCLNSHDALLELMEQQPHKFHEQGTTHYIEIKLENIEVTDPYCALHHEARPGPFVVLSVTDDGPGISKEIMERIFEPFFTTKKQGRGTGLGLSTVFGIVKQHNGWVNVESEPGWGAVFRAYFPRYVGETKAEKSPQNLMDVPSGTETILLVDDEEIIRNLGRTILEHKGYTVLLAEDGQEGLTVFQQHREEIALVILDLTMPQLSGQEVLTEILTIDPSTKVLMSTGYSTPEQVTVLENLGSRGFIPKPYEPSDLLSMVRMVLDKK